MAGQAAIPTESYGNFGLAWAGTAGEAPGDSEGPRSFIFRAASLQKLDLPNLLHVQDTPNDKCTAAPKPDLFRKRVLLAD